MRVVHWLIFLGAFWTSAAQAPAELRRRILIIPFDNMRSEANYDWMTVSIEENLKTELAQTGKFDLMDATLLRKINPELDFEQLSEEDAMKLAQKLNCEAAIIGRYFITKKKGKDARENVLLQAEGVDALTGKAILIKSHYSEIDSSVFNTVQTLAVEIAREFAEKLPPIPLHDAKRDAKLEKLIFRFEHPPRGFIDTVDFGQYKIQPEFDIDVFEYEIRMDAKNLQPKNQFTLRYELRGERFEPVRQGQNLQCQDITCTFTGEDGELIVAASAEPNAVRYRFRLHLTDSEFAKKPEPLSTQQHHVWAAVGVPVMGSVALLGQASPETMAEDSKLPLSSVTGRVQLEAGYRPERWQPLKDYAWSALAQWAYAGGDMARTGSTAVGINFMSFGAQARLERRFAFGKNYSLAPMAGVGLHYQRFYRTFSTGTSALVFAPELGVNNYYSHPSLGRYQVLGSVVGGSYIYSGQNLTYVRFNLGVEYAF